MTCMTRIPDVCEGCPEARSTQRNGFWCHKYDLRGGDLCPTLASAEPTNDLDKRFIENVKTTATWKAKQDRVASLGIKIDPDKEIIEIAGIRYSFLFFEFFGDRILDKKFKLIRGEDGQITIEEVEEPPVPPPGPPEIIDKCGLS